jgi:hypothetical protein
MIETSSGMNVIVAVRRILGLIMSLYLVAGPSRQFDQDMKQMSKGSSMQSAV